MKNNQKNKKEDFQTWKLETLAEFADECYAALKAEQEANEHLRRDLRDAMKIIRQRHSEINGALPK